MKKLITAATAAFLMSMGCASEGTGTNILIRLGVAEFIGGEAQTANGVIEFTNDALTVLNGDPVVLVEELRDYAENKVPWGMMRPSQRIIAMELFTIVEARLLDGVQAGELPADSVVRLRQLLEIANRQAKTELRFAQ